MDSDVESVKGVVRRQGRYQRRSAKDFFCNLSNARRLVRRNSMNTDFFIRKRKDAK
ncbi:hypothetical protein KIN20_018054 [Parelaphostrongylus tenuis]|uniref:Uncharacterized protein n=1 Tax=Parelaphostrongylus tenuis TaxID=148309 RepID=A0AAD5MIQ7_PARTN|nr:hypothetical protein KIN20_018054 [Parelaphostrongylus tenuis]